jgi:hypothetical protein
LPREWRHSEGESGGQGDETLKTIEKREGCVCERIREEERKREREEQAEGREGREGWREKEREQEGEKEREGERERGRQTDRERQTETKRDRECVWQILRQREIAADIDHGSWCCYFLRR